MSTKLQPLEMRLFASCGKVDPIVNTQLSRYSTHCRKNFQNSGHGSKLGRYSWTHQHGITPGDALDMAIGEFPTCQQLKGTLSHQYVHASQVNKPATWWQFDYIGPLPSWTRKQFVLFGIDAYYRKGFAFTANNEHCQNTIHDFGDCFTHCQ